VGGPILAVLVLISDLNAEDSAWMRHPAPARLGQLISPAKHHHKANIIMGVTVVVATFVRLGQVAPLGEVSFLRHLGIYQFFVSLAGLVAARFISPAERSPGVLFYRADTLLIVASFLVATYRRRFPPSKAKALQQISSYCTLQRDYPIPSVSFGEENKGQASDEEGNGSFLAWYFASLFLIFFITISFPEQVHKSLRYCWEQYRRLCGWFHIGLRRFPVVCLALGFTVVSLFMVTSMLGDLLG